MRNTSEIVQAKLAMHDVIVNEFQARAMTRHDLERLTHRKWSRQCWNRLWGGPTRHPHSEKKLADIVQALGYEVQREVRVVKAGARQLPCRHAVPLAG